MSEPHILLYGEKLGLGLPRADMFPDYHRWESEPIAILGFGAQVPELYEVRAARYESEARSERQARFEIVRLDDHQPIGVTVLQIDHRVRTAEYAILLAPEVRGRGHAGEATRLTLDWAFHLGGLRMAWLRVLEHNSVGIRAYERAGFRLAGRLRRSGYWLGEPCDELLMDAILDEFPGPSAVLDRLAAVNVTVPPEPASSDSTGAGQSAARSRPEA